jgi:hypothetical protein
MAKRKSQVQAALENESDRLGRMVDAFNFDIAKLKAQVDAIMVARGEIDREIHLLWSKSRTKPTQPTQPK